MEVLLENAQSLLQGDGWKLIVMWLIGAVLIYLAIAKDMEPSLENIIDGNENVLLSCVIGVKDPYKMQKVKAFVVLKPGVAPTEAVRQDLMAYCRKRIAKYAMPYEIEFREELPKTLVGKVAYRVLEEEAEKEQHA